MLKKMRGGVLGDTSVHSFVDSGILPQLLAYLLAFVALGHLMLLEDVGIFEVVGNGIHGRVLPSFKLNVNNCVARLM